MKEFLSNNDEKLGNFNTKSSLFLNNITPLQIEKLLKGNIVKISEIILENQQVEITNQLFKFYKLFKESNNQLYLTIDVIRLKENNFASVVFVPVYIFYANDIYSIKISGKPFINKKLLKLYRENTGKNIIDSILNIITINNISKEINDNCGKELIHENYLIIENFSFEKFILPHDKFQKNNKIGLYSSKELELLEIEKRTNIKKTNHNQRIAIELALNGESFAIDGVRYSGKTQTILNIISNLVLQDKKVLYLNDHDIARDDFVSRLDDLNLYKYYLKLNEFNYSIINEINEKGSLKELEYKPYPSEVFSVRKSIKRYERFIHQRIKGFKFVEVMYELMKVKKFNQDIDLSLNEIKSIRKQDFILIVDVLQENIEKIQNLGVPKDSVWINLNTNLILSDLKKEVEDVISLLKSESVYMVKMLESIIKTYNMSIDYNNYSVRDFIKLLRGINLMSYPNQWLNTYKDVFNQAEKRYKNYFSMFEQRDLLKDEIDYLFNNEVYDIDITSYVKALKQNKFNKFMIHDYLEYRDNLKQTKRNYDALFKLEERVQKVVKNETILSKEYFSILYQIYEYKINNKIISKLWKEIDLKNKARINKYNKILSDFLDDFDKVKEYFKFDDLFNKKFNIACISVFKNNNIIKRNKSIFKENLNYINSISKRDLKEFGYKKINEILEDTIDINKYKQHIGIIKKFINQTFGYKINDFSEAKSILDSYNNFKNIDYNLINKYNLESVLYEDSTDFMNLFARCNALYINIQKLYKAEYNLIKDIYNVQNSRIILNEEISYISLLGKIKGLLRPSIQFSLENIIKGIDLINKFNTLDYKLNNDKDIFELYNLTGDDNSLDMLEIYEKVNKFKKIITYFGDFKNLSKVLTNKDKYDNLQESIHKLRASYFKLTNGYRRYNNIFYNGSAHLIDSDFYENIAYYDNLTGNKHLIEDWVTFSRNLQVLRKYEQETLIKKLWENDIINIIESYKYSYFKTLYDDFINTTDENYNEIKNNLEKIDDEYEVMYANNIIKLKENLGVNTLVYNSILRNMRRKKANSRYIYSKVVQLFNIFISDINTFNSYLDITDYDVIIIDDVELIDIGKLTNVLNANQIIFTGNSKSSIYETNNILYRIRESNKIVLNHSYGTKYKKIIDFENMYLGHISKNIQLCSSGKNIISLIKSQSDLHKFLLRVNLANNDSVINVFLGDDEYKEFILDNMLSRINNLKDNKKPEKLLKLTSFVNFYKQNSKAANISIIDVDSIIYYYSKYSDKDIELLLMKALDFTDKLYIFDNGNYLGKESNNPIVKLLKKLIEFKEINNKIEQNDVMNNLIDDRISLNVGNRDLEYQIITNNSALGIKVYDLLSVSDINYIEQKRIIDLYKNNDIPVVEVFLHDIIDNNKSLDKVIKNMEVYINEKG